MLPRYIILESRIMFDDFEQSLDSIIVSQSEADTFLKCERAHYYAHTLNGGLMPKRLSPGLSRGIFGHDIMQHFWEQKRDGMSWDEATEDTMKYLLRQAVEQNVDPKIAGEVKHLVSTFFTSPDIRERCDAWEILWVEQTFILPVDDRIRFPFKPDLVVKEKGLPIIVDWKFIYDFYDDSMLKLLGQIPKYAGSLRAMGIEVRGGLYVQFRYRSTAENKSDPRLAIRIDPVPLSNKRITSTFAAQIKTAKRIAEIRLLSPEEQDIEAIRSPDSMKCKRMCSFTDLCVAQLNGSSGALMIEHDFASNTYGYTEGD